MTLGRQEKIKPLRQPRQYERFPFTSLKVPFFTGQYERFPSTFLKVPFFTDYDLSLNVSFHLLPFYYHFLMKMNYPFESVGMGLVKAYKDVYF